MSREDDENKAIGERIQALRGRRQMTQERLADELSKAIDAPIAQQTIAKIEKGVRPLKLFEAQHLAEILRSPLTDLVPGDELTDGLFDLETQMQTFEFYVDALSRQLKGAMESQRRAREAWAATPENVQQLYFLRRGGDERAIANFLNKPVIEVVLNYSSRTPHGPAT